MIPTDQEGTGSSTGKILCGGRLLPYVSTEAGTVIRKGPLVRSDNSRWLDPVTAPRRDIPRSWKASLTREPTRNPRAESPMVRSPVQIAQAFAANSSNSVIPQRQNAVLVEIWVSTSPSMFEPSRPITKSILRSRNSRCCCSNSPRCAIWTVIRVLTVKPSKHGREQAGHRRLVGPNSDLAQGRVVEKLDIPHALTQMVKDGR